MKTWHRFILHLFYTSAVYFYVRVNFMKMLEDSPDDDEFSNMALCICSSAESITVSEDELAHIQVSTGS